MRIQHNIMAMNAYRNYNNNSAALSKNLEKLSSGYKINRAGDDAAGLAISEKMRAQITGLSAAQKNVKDGISLVKTAEGAMQEIHDMLNRMDYLATQSANGTYDNEVDRLNLQKEVDQLINEIDRIADSANFNGIKLLDGTWDTDAAGKAQEAIDAAQAKIDNPEFETAYKDVDTAAMTGLLLPEPTTGTLPVAGTNTVLEVSGIEGGKPGFEVELDGFSYGVKTPGTDTIKLTVGSVAVTSDAIGTTGGDAMVLDAAAIAQLFDGKTLTSTDLKDGTSNMTFNIKADGTKLIFTPTTEPGSVINSNLNVKIEGTETTKTKVDATTAKYTTGVLTSNGGTAAADDSIVFAVAYKDANGDAQSKDITVAGDAASTAASVATSLIDAINADDDLKALFTASGSNTGIIMTANEEGADKGSVTGITVKTEGAFKAQIGTAPTTTGAQVTGADATFTGPDGSLNVGTVNIKLNNEGSSDRLANTEVNLSDYFTDGTQITLGKTTYTVAVGKDSAYKDGENVLDLTEYETAADVDAATAASKLTELARKSGDTVFSVGNDAAHAGYISLQQMSAAKDETNMETMDGLLDYIKIKTVDADATAKAKADAVAAAEDELAKAQENARQSAGAKNLKLQIGDTSDDFNQLGVKIGSMKTTALGIDSLSIANAEDAANAIQIVKDAINYVSGVRGDLGAYQNRLEHTGNNLSVMAENIQDAESTIRDTDVAEEMMGYVKNNILVQSAQAMLAQANQVPQGVLQLLG